MLNTLILVGGSLNENRKLYWEVRLKLWPYIVNGTYQKTVDVIRPSNEVCEVSELLGESQKDLIFIVNCFSQKWDKFASSALHSKR